MRFCAKRLPFFVATLSIVSTFDAALVLGAPTDITSIAFTKMNGPGSVENDVTGAGKTTGIFDNNHEYDLNYTGDATRVNSIVTGGLTYVPGAAASYVFRRTNTPNSDIVYYVGSGSSSSADLTLDGPQVGSLSDTFAGNNLDVGVDNVFANRADKNGNFANIERVDFVFSGGIAATPTKGFSIIERGNAGDHD